MKRIGSDEIFRNLSEFLKGKGIELTQGSYSQAIQKGCALLTDAVNLSQEGLEKAKTGIETKADQMRQVIHEKTAPKNQTARPKPVEKTPPTAKTEAKVNGEEKTPKKPAKAAAARKSVRKKTVRRKKS